MAITKRTILWTLVGSCIVLAGVSIWTFGWYPIALVNWWHPVYAYQLNRSLDLAAKYYGSVINVNDPKNFLVLKSAVLQGLVDDVAITRRLEQDMSSGELNQKIDDQAQQFFSDKNVQQWLAKNNLSEGEVRAYLLSGMIKSNLLSGQLSLEQKNFSSWLGDARKDLKVLLLIRGVHWTDNEIKFDN